MSNLPKTSIDKLLKSIDINSLSDECYPMMRYIFEKELESLLEGILSISGNKKILTVEDIYSSLKLKGKYVCRSDTLIKKLS